MCACVCISVCVEVGGPGCQEEFCTRLLATFKASGPDDVSEHISPRIAYKALMDITLLT